MREQGYTVWLVLGAVVLVVLNLPEPLSRTVKGGLREGISPLQGLVTGVSRDFRESIKIIRGLGGLAVENQKLAAELVQLRNEVLQKEALERENLDLREQLQFLQSVERRLIPCELIARDISGWWQSIRVGKGTVHGVAPGRAVITSDGVIGRTIDVSSGTADVLLLSDPSCKVSARILRTDSFGVISGQGVLWNGQVVLNMEFINKNVEVRPGDEVVTSGLGGVYPKGLLIGYVERVHKDRYGLFQRAEVIPKAEFGSLVYVFVVAEEEDPVGDLLKRKTGEQEEGE